MPVYLCTFVCVYICVSYVLHHILKYKWTGFYFSRCHVNYPSRDEQTSTQPHQVATDQRDDSTQVQLGGPMTLTVNNYRNKGEGHLQKYGQPMGSYTAEEMSAPSQSYDLPKSLLTAWPCEAPYPAL